MLNDGKHTPMPDANPLSLVPLAPEPVKPFNVERASSAPLLTATELTNFAYQRLLAGTPWQYYRLVVTQWPRMDGNQATPIPALKDGSVPNTFPGTDAFSAFANVTMETFDQRVRPARLHELPQPRAHEHRLHVDAAQPRASGAVRAGPPERLSLIDGPLAPCGAKVQGFEGSEATGDAHTHVDFPNTEAGQSPGEFLSACEPSRALETCEAAPRSRAFSLMKP